jgi:putative SOS response-associated peptidase YedK
MIITEPSDFAAQIHDRMPAFLTEGQFALWLSGEAGAGILKPAPSDFLATLVGIEAGQQLKG